MTYRTECQVFCRNNDGRGGESGIVPQLREGGILPILVRWYRLNWSSRAGRTSDPKYTPTAAKSVPEWDNYRFYR